MTSTSRSNRGSNLRGGLRGVAAVIVLGVGVLLVGGFISWLAVLVTTR